MSDDDRALLGSAHDHIRRGEVAAGLDLLRSVLVRNPEDVALHWIVGTHHLGQNQPERSLDDFRRAIALDECCVPAWGGLGRALMDLGRWAEAKVALERRLELGPSANHWVFLSRVLRELGQHDGALRCCEQALGLDGNQVDALLNRAHLLSLRGGFDRALDSCERAIGVDAGYVEAHLTHGAVLLRAGRREDAFAAYHRALDVDPESVPAYRDLAITVAGWGDDALGVIYDRTADDLERDRPSGDDQSA